MHSPAPTLAFLGVHSHPLHAAREFLAGCARPGMDLSRVLVVPPTARAGRTLLSLLARRAHEDASGRGGAWRPPRVESLTSLVDRLAASPRRGPSPLEDESAWALALASLSAEELAPLSPMPSHEDLDSFARGLSRLLLRSVGELTLHGVGVAEAAKRLDDAGAFAEGDRWRVVARAQELATARLAAAGLDDPIASRFALLAESATPREAPEHVVLVGVAEVPPLARAALSGLARAGARLWACVPAPEDERPGFDAWGAPRTDHWNARPARLRDQGVRVVDSALDQAHAALEFLEGLGEECRPDSAAIVLCDPDLSELLRARGAAAGVTIRDAGGRPLLESPACALVDLACHFVARPTFDAWGSLLRHPDVERFVALDRGMTRDRPHEAWLAELDRYVQDHVQAGARADTLVPQRLRDAKLDLVLDSTRRLLGGLWAAPDRSHQTLRHPLARWASLLMEMLSRAHAGVRPRPHVPREAALVGALRALASALHAGATQRVHPTLDAPVPVGEARRWLRSRLEGVSSPPEHDAGAIEAIGWLEAPWDEAPNLVVVGANMGHLPSRRSSDPLLPEPSRRTLGLPTQADRAARDRFLLEVVARTRPSVRWIAGKRSARGDPLVPSRFLLEREGDRAPRARAWVAGGVSRRPEPLVAPGLDSFSTMPTPTLPEVRAMGVTAFRDYIASPYCFYVRHVLRSDGVRDEPLDLDAAAFGSLVHDAAARLATLDHHQLRSARGLREFLLDALEQIAMDRFGPRHGVPVQLQLEQARERLARLALWQAARAQAGWHIRHAEWQPGEEDALILDEADANMRLRGRIDRIDQHDSGAYCLLDIKTGDDVADPDSTHRRGNEWIDLQLPLYRHLASRIVGDAPVELAYVRVGGHDRPVELAAAPWNDEHLAGADAKAVEVARAVRRGEFRLSGERPPDAVPLAWLLGRRFLGSSDQTPEGEAEP